MKDNSLIQFVRDRKGQPRGVVVATVIDNKVKFGWSYTNTKLGDRFNKMRGLQIAFGRAEVGQCEMVRTPHSVTKVLKKMTDRANKYFQSDR